MKRQVENALIVTARESGKMDQEKESKPISKSAINGSDKTIKDKSI